MFFSKNKGTNTEYLKSLKKIEMLERIIDSQNEELIRLRYLSKKSEALTRQEEELEKLTEMYKGLCDEVRECKKKYDELNKTLTATMRQYSKEMQTLATDDFIRQNRRRFL